MSDVLRVLGIGGATLMQVFGAGPPEIVRGLLSAEELPQQRDEGGGPLQDRVVLAA